MDDSVQHRWPEPDETPRQSRPSVLSEGVVVTGDIDVPGAIHLQGTVKGKVQADQIVIGHPGSLDGEIDATTVSIAGTFNGTLRCSELSVAHNAKVTGNVRCRSLKLQPGAKIDGDISVDGTRS